MSPLLQILYEDDDFLAIDKPAGILSEGSETSLLAMAEDYAGKAITLYHRLDRLATGVILMGKSRRWNADVARLFSEKRIRKEYWAMVQGYWPRGIQKVETMIVSKGNGVWANSDVSGKRAITTFRLLGQAGKKSWMQVLPKTGRTHQIRLHCLKAGCPIVGDSLYGDDASIGPIALHARSLRFIHPGSGRTLPIVAEPPPYWTKWFRAL